MKKPHWYWGIEVECNKVLKWMNVKKSSNFIKHTLRYSDKPYDFYCLQMLWDNDSHNLELNGYNYQNKIEKY